MNFAKLAFLVGFFLTIRELYITKHQFPIRPKWLRNIIWFLGGFTGGCAFSIIAIIIQVIWFKL